MILINIGSGNDLLPGSIKILRNVYHSIYHIFKRPSLPPGQMSCSSNRKNMEQVAQHKFPYPNICIFHEMNFQYIIWMKVNPLYSLVMRPKRWMYSVVNFFSTNLSIMRCWDINFLVLKPANWTNQVNAMAANALAPCVARSSATMVLTALCLLSPKGC